MLKKLTNAQIATAFNALSSIANNKYPAGLSFNIAKNIRILEPLMRLIEEERNKIIRKYDVVKQPVIPANPTEEDKKLMHEFEARLAEANKEFGDIQDIESDIEIHAIRESLFANVEITPLILVSIDCLIDHTG